VSAHISWSGSVLFGLSDGWDYPWWPLTGGCQPLGLGSVFFGLDDGWGNPDGSKQESAS